MENARASASAAQQQLASMTENQSDLAMLREQKDAAVATIANLRQKIALMEARLAVEEGAKVRPRDCISIQT